MARKRFVQVGLGGRSRLFSSAVIEKYADCCQMAGFCDINEGRLKLAVDEAGRKGAAVPGYLAKDFDRMIAETRPDCVIVTTRDCFHDEYICRALELGCDVITEKPMTTDEVKCQRVLDAVRTTGRKCTVTFNYRYSPPRTQVKDLLMSGVIGEVLSVDFHWLLDTHHGTDYFRRWHRNKANSGGLMVHKATHHFDLVNWWLSTVPQTVFALGHRRFYTPRMADRLGLARRGDRCHTCPEGDKCTFRLDLAGNASLKRLYLDNEQYDGYLRDQCVFSDKIDIEDSMNVVVAYANGVKMSYSLNAFCAWEGYMVAFNGTQGRLEHSCQEKVYINADGTVPGALKKEGTHIRIFPQRRAAYEVDLWTASGGHGGGDDPMLEDLFATAPPADKYLRAADHRSGAWSILTGVAANKSMAGGQSVNVAALVRGLDMPDYPAMPSGNEPLRIPAPQQ
jgi:predicted dehydrogenase